MVIVPIPSACANDPRADAYKAGMQKPSENGNLLVTLLESQPGPPAIGNNSWTIAVQDAVAPDSGSAERNDLSISAVPWMPDHGHGTSIVPTVTPKGSDGQYTINPLYLFMAGLWQVTLHMSATGPAQVTDQVVFSFCL
jgi:hypothetical protein